jgi:N6-adenosine-specific RNA methylase IME4
MEFPNKKYKIIYCDPAWLYDDRALAGNRGAGCKYTVMSSEDLEKLPVESICEDDCIMFMWVTMPKLLDGTCMKVMRAWGFIPKTCAFNWVKYHKNLASFMGMGRWTRANSELCILGTRGHPERMSAGVKQMIEEYTGETLQSIPERHSKKPDMAREKIVELCGDISRIELFAREKKNGWDSWGNEI